MFIASANFKLKLGDFQKEDFIPLPSNETEKKVFRLVNQWINGENSFTFHSSGSTGRPKKITISRKKIIQSTRFTFDYLDRDRSIQNCLLCIDPAFIGGAMVVFRALIMDLDLYLIEPTSSVTATLPADFATDLVSMVPMQYQNLKPNEVDQFRNILIGGAAIGILPNPSSSHIFATYGMTETVSHIAIRTIDATRFTPLGDTKVALDNRGCLKIRGTMTDDVWMQTNDLAKIENDHTFQWMGRSDFIINSGGIKLNPEAIEEKLKKEIKGAFIITSLPDPTLGEKVVLVLERTLDHKVTFEWLEKYEKPKLIIENQEISLTASGKVDRIKTKNNLLESQE